MLTDYDTDFLLLRVFSLTLLLFLLLLTHLLLLLLFYCLLTPYPPPPPPTPSPLCPSRGSITLFPTCSPQLPRWPVTKVCSFFPPPPPLVHHPLLPLLLYRVPKVLSVVLLQFSIVLFPVFPYYIIIYVKVCLILHNGIRACTHACACLCGGGGGGGRGGMLCVCVYDSVCVFVSRVVARRFSLSLRT